MKFWILWAFDLLVALVFVYFFLVGLTDGSVSSFNIVLWLGILGFFGAILAWPIWLRHKGHGTFAVVLLGIPMVPAILFALFFGILILSNPRWN